MNVRMESASQIFNEESHSSTFPLSFPDLFSVSLILGCVAAAFHVLHIVSILVPPGSLRRFPWLTKRLSASAMFSSMHSKQAASYKMSQMARNALEIVRVNEEERITLNTHFAQALGEFAKSGKKYRSVGGFRWSLRRIWSSEAFYKDGIWLSTRLIASNIAQWIVSLYVLLSGLNLTSEVATNWSSDESKQYFYSTTEYFLNASVDESLVANATNQATGVFGQFLASQTDPSALGCPPGNATALVNEYCKKIAGLYQCDPASNVSLLCPIIENPDMDAAEQLALLNSAGFDTGPIESLARSSLQQATDQSVESLYPSESYMVVVPLYIATCELIRRFESVWFEMGQLVFCRTNL